MKILLVRPPRHYWPILNESDNFLLPLGFPCIAAYVRREVPEVEVEILDCCVSKIGWASLAEILKEKKPDVVCAGEKVCYAHEGHRLFDLAKSIVPNVVTVSGGHFSSHEPAFTLEQSACDYVIRYEGEIPFAKLIESLLGRVPIEDVPNLVWVKAGVIQHNSIGGHIQNLDDLPIPAYDLAPLNKYAPFGLLWPKAVTIQRTRGCVDTCRFCSWITVEARHVRQENGEIEHRPAYRSKSVDRMVEETELLYEKYGVRYLFWVDATWNTDHKWLDAYCSEIIRRKYKLGWWAFTRIDLLLEQERLGILEKMVRAGLRHVLVGVERPTADSLNWLGKHGYGEDMAVKAFHLLRDKYPEVFRQGTFITGIRPDTAQSIRDLLAYAHKCDVDFAAFHPMTPFPGTPLYEDAVREGWLEEFDFAKYDMFNPIMPTEHLTREEVAHWTTWCQANFVQKRPLRYARRMFSRQKNRRHLHWWFMLSISRVMANQAINHVRGKEAFDGFGGVNRLWKPAWYDA